LKRLEKVAAEKDDGATRNEAMMLAAELAEQPEPVLPRLLASDATAEKLGMLLAEQRGRIASMSAEGGVFDLMAGQYSKSGIPQFEVYLKGHSGDDLRTDRVSRPSIQVERPALTCAFAMQPAVIRGLADKPSFRGRGLLGRFLYAAPRSWIGDRQIGAPPVAEEASLAYRSTVRTLFDVDGAIIRLDVRAEGLLRDWEAEVETMLADGGPLETMRDWGGKLVGATVRIAGILHCVQHSGPTGLIAAPTIRAAITIARYLIPHAEVALNLMHAQVSPVADDARYLLRWIERHELREFTKRDAHQHGKRRFPRAEDIDPALEELERRGYIRSQPSQSTGPGRPPSPSYEVNPAVFDCQHAGDRSHNSHNPPDAGNGSHSGNTEDGFGRPEDSDRERFTL
jgi:hypothetical protein